MRFVRTVFLWYERHNGKDASYFSRLEHCPYPQSYSRFSRCSYGFTINSPYGMKSWKYCLIGFTPINLIFLDHTQVILGQPYFLGIHKVNILLQLILLVSILSYQWVVSKSWKYYFVEFTPINTIRFPGDLQAVSGEWCFLGFHKAHILCLLFLTIFTLPYLRAVDEIPSTWRFDIGSIPPESWVGVNSLPRKSWTVARSHTFLLAFFKKFGILLLYARAVIFNCNSTRDQ